MLGLIVSFLLEESRSFHVGFLPISRFSMIRWPVPQGQSNAIHFVRPPDVTTIAPRRGSFSGISSADSTVATIFHRPKGSHWGQDQFCQGILTRATLVPERALSFRGLICRRFGHSSARGAALPCLWKFLVREAKAGPHWDAVWGRTR
jgi:hypothetical protein